MILPGIGTTSGAQRASQSIAATSGADGTIKFVGPQGIQGSTITCVVTVPVAPVGATFQATLGTIGGQGVVLDTWNCTSTAGRFQIGVGQTLVVTGTGLEFNTFYTCTFSMIIDVGDVQLVLPEPNSSTVTALTTGPAPPIPPVPPAAGAFRQSGAMSAQALTGAPGTVLSAPCAIGSMVAVGIVPGAHSPVETVASVVSLMGTFTKVIGYNGGAAVADLEWWVCLATTASGTAITVTTAFGSGWVACALEFTGSFTAAASGGSATNTGTAISLTLTNTVGQVALAMAKSASTAFTVDPTSPWISVNAGGFIDANGFGAAWQITAATPVTATWTIGISNGWSAVGALVS